MEKKYSGPSIDPQAVSAYFIEVIKSQYGLERSSISLRRTNKLRTQVFNSAKNYKATISRMGKC